MLVLTNVKAQQISSEKYNTTLISEDFHSVSNTFKIITTVDNYFIVDNGDYLMSRNNEESEFAVIAKESKVSDFILRTCVKIGPSKSNSTIGLILKAQQNGKGAIIFEINKKKQYRIKKLNGDTYTIISGQKKKDGWIRSKKINGVDKQNFIEIRSERNIYDVYINSNFLTSFFIPDFTNGSCGLIISPSTKVRISHYYINVKNNNQISNIKNSVSKEESLLIEELNKKIILLEKNNKKINNINKSINKSRNIKIDSLTFIMNKKEVEKSDLKREINELNNKITLLKDKTEITEQLEFNYNELKKEYSNTKQEINRLRSNEKKVQNTNTFLEKNNSLLKEENKKLKENTSIIEKTNIESTTEIKKYKKIIKDVNKEIVKYKEKVQNEVLSNNSLREENEIIRKEKEEQTNQLKNTILKIKEQIGILEVEKNDLSNELKIQIENTIRARDNITDKKLEIKDLDRKIKEINTNLSSLKIIQKEYDKEKEKINKENTTLNDSIKHLLNKLSITLDELDNQKKKNKDLKELFIIRDFEKEKENKIKYIKNKNNLKKEDQLFYTVQIGVYMKTQPYLEAEGISNIWFEETKYGTFIYMSGKFNNPEEAILHKNKLARAGYSNAFILKKNK